MGSKIAAVVPVYNIKNYLPALLDSLLEQTNSFDQIILVDDGSSDGSELICDEYAMKSNTISVLHQQNQGVSAARNNGLNLCYADYVCFIDGDDLIHEQYVEMLLAAMVKNDVELAICGYTRNISELGLVNSIDCVRQSSFIYHDGLDKNSPDGYFDGYLWNKVFSVKIIRNNNLRFLENCKIWEDMLFFVEYLKYVNSVVFVGKSLYWYRMRESSAVYSIDYNRMANKVQVMKRIVESELFDSEVFKLWAKTIYLENLIDFGIASIKNKKLSKEKRNCILAEIKKYKVKTSIKQKIKYFVICTAVWL